MRLTLLLTALTLAATTNMGRAQEPESWIMPPHTPQMIGGQAGWAMPQHGGYIDACEADLKRLLPNTHGASAIERTMPSFCQCEQEHLPAAGMRVDMARLAQATDMCNAEAKRGRAHFRGRYYEDLITDLALSL